ncbi:MAG: hypothetical protein GXP63_06140 [DPANN group archaeon]|nr:hypothetical protein [DPANN group archaeon]
MAQDPRLRPLVGRSIVVIQYQGKDLQPALMGTIEEDTRFSLRVRIPGGKRTFLKQSLVCMVQSISDHTIKGETLIGTIHERIKNIKHR